MRYLTLLIFFIATLSAPSSLFAREVVFEILVPGPLIAATDHELRIRRTAQANALKILSLLSVFTGLQNKKAGSLPVA